MLCYTFLFHLNKKYFKLFFPFLKPKRVYKQHCAENLVPLREDPLF